VIYFYCPGCREPLEGEDSIKGTRMACPACGKEIEVPQVSVKPPSATTRLLDLPLWGVRFLVIVLVAGAIGLGGVTAVGYFIRRQAEQAAREKSRCGACAGRGTTGCVRCGGNRKFGCPTCKGTGTSKNVRDEDQRCYDCAGKGVRDCVPCGGRGVYACAGCSGTGVEGGKAPEEPSHIKGKAPGEAVK
jgi:hypothetical protein